MIRRIQTILVAICLVLFFFQALFLLFSRAPWEPLQVFFAQAFTVPAPSVPISVQVLILIIGLVLVLVIGYFQVLQLREEVFFTRQTEEGAVTISDSAIRRYVRQVAADVESVQNVQARVTNTDKGLVVDLLAKVVVTDTLPRIEQIIRARVREALEQTLGVGSVAAINVIIEKFEMAVSRPLPSTTSVKLSGEGGSRAGGESSARLH